MQVQILMSTYNGEKYLQEQIDSIVNQSIGLEHLYILVRDDGSSDSTVDILEGYKKQYPDNFDFFVGENVGPCRSFMKLAKTANQDFDFFAFSDQDDIWLPEKIEVAVKTLSSKSRLKPLLYSSKYTNVDENLKVIKRWKAKKVAFGSFPNSLIENVSTGYTQVFNKKSLLLLNKVDDTTVKNFYMHDWILYMIATSLGEFIYDSNSYSLYRQHETNVMGISKGPIHGIRRKYKLFLRYNSGNILKNNAKGFYKVYGNMISIENKRILEQFLDKSFISSFKLGFSRNMKRQKLFDSLVFRVLLILNRI